MLTPDDRRAIDGLFQRLSAVEQQAREPRDPEAEALIERRMSQIDGAPYYMAQTLVVQQRALEAAEQRISELEDQVGRGRYNPRDRYDDQRADDGPWNRGAGRGMGGGGFLAGAMQTALGVTGGMLLGSMIGGLFGAGSANAAEAPADTNADSGNDADTDTGDTGSDFGGDGGDFGGGGFDGGGDF